MIMEVDVLMQTVSTLGFPIVFCFVLFWKMVTDDKRHKEEMDQITNALNNNTQALIKLSERIERGVTN